MFSILSLPPHKQFVFQPKKIARAVAVYGGVRKLACAIAYSEKQVRRAIHNHPRVSPHLRRDIIAALGVAPSAVGHVIDVLPY